MVLNKSGTAVSGGESSLLMIKNYGPATATARQPFNVQSDGSSAIWFMIEDFLRSDIVVEFDGLCLKTFRADNVVTAMVPDCLLQSPRTLKIRIIDEACPERCACVEFTIVANPVEENIKQPAPVLISRPDRPNFFLIGAPRSGTTSMYWQLRAHPDIYMSRIKEPYFFDKRAHGVLTGAVTSEEGYNNLFKFAPFQTKIIGEASATYLSSPDALIKIKKYSPDAKILVLLRNPLMASISMYLQSKKGGVYEHEASFEDAWAACQNKPDTRPFVVDFPRLFKIGDQLTNVYSIFDREKVKVVIFDDLSHDSAAVFEEVLCFLDLTADRRSAIAKSNSADWGAIKSVAPDYLVKELIEYYGPQVKMLSEHLGRNLDHWLTPDELTT